MANKIVFSASVARVQTMCDNSLRVTFDMPEGAVQQAAALMQCKVDGIALRVEVMADMEVPE
jgi:predicted Zn-dependent protease